MLFPSEEFLLIFLPAVLVVYYALHLFAHSITAKNVWLFLASIIFYAWGEPVYVFLMLLSIVFNHLMALAVSSGSIQKKRAFRRTLLILTISVNILILFWFKYADAVFAKTVLSGVVSRIVLPIGISFYTFQAMSYVIDVYTGRIQPEKNPLYVGLYISFFPQLIAGPIVRYGTISERIRKRSESLSGFTKGAERFIRGIIKKVLIANRMAAVADAVWVLIIGDRLQAPVSLAWVGAISYTLQIFFDFSGYSDMAIGLGGMFGFDLPENFDHPYIADSVTQFWRRWHMTLSGWFKDYVYIPLGGSKKGKARLVLNLFIVWLLTGIWHGDNLTFILWGMIYFTVLTVEKLTGLDRPAKKILTKAVKHILTLFVVVIAWVVFRSDSIGDALIFIKGMFVGVSGAGSHSAALAYIKQNALYYVAAVTLCMPTRKWLKDKCIATSERIAVVYDITYGLLMAAGFILAMTFIYNNSYNPFIYFNF